MFPIEQAQSRYYDWLSRPISLEEWAWLRKTDNHLAETLITSWGKPKIRISTVWLGLEHNLDPDGPPLIFETMIFGGRRDQEQHRYTTGEEALSSHWDIVRRLSWFGLRRIKAVQRRGGPEIG